MTTSHFQLEPGMWPRGTAVEVRGEYIFCRLDREHAYWLLGAGTRFLDGYGYERRAHLEFLRAKSPESLLQFVRNWGPLGLGRTDWEKAESTIAVGRYRRWQRYLGRLVGLFSSVRNGSDESRALGEFLKDRSEQIPFISATARSGPRPAGADFLAWLASFQNAVLNLPKEADELGVQAGKGDEIVHLLDQAPLRHLQELTNLAISKCTLISATLETRREGRRGRIFPSLKAAELRDAMECMVILDEWANHPLQICTECGDLFRVDTQHARRFCSSKCSRRVSSREFKRKQRSQKMREKEKRKRKRRKS